MLKDTTLIGEIPGKTSLIIAGVHGNEKCGIEAFDQLLPSLVIESGTVHFLYGNPGAINKNVRFVDTNLNRLFRDDDKLSQEQKESYEYSQMKRIQEYLLQADALLDIHASNTPDSQPFIIAENNSQEIIDKLPISICVSGFDILEPGGTDGYMNSLGKIGICIECGYTNNQHSTEVAMKSILDFLSAMGHIKNKSENNVEKEKVFYHMDTLYHTHTDSFKLEKEFDDFEPLVQGQIIGYDGDTIVKAEKDGIILFARNRDTIGAEAFLFGEEK